MSDSSKDSSFIISTFTDGNTASSLQPNDIDKSPKEAETSNTMDERSETSQSSMNSNKSTLGEYDFKNNTVLYPNRSACKTHGCNRISFLTLVFDPVNRNWQILLSQQSSLFFLHTKWTNLAEEIICNFSLFSTLGL